MGMEIVEQILAEQKGRLVEAVTSQSSLDREQAESFVPPAVREVVETVRGGGLDLGSLLGGGGFGDLIQKLDVGGVAARAGVDPEQARSGLQGLLPVLMQVLQQKGGGAEGLMGMLGGGGGQGAAGLLGKLGGLFKR